MPNFGPFLPCVILRMPENPISLCFSATREPKLGQNWINSECCHDTIACQISSHSFHVFSQCPETPISLGFFYHQRAKTGQNQTIFKGGQNTSARHISDQSFHEFSLECPRIPILLSFLSTRGPKLGQYWSKSNDLWRWSGFVSRPHFTPLSF